MLERLIGFFRNAPRALPVPPEPAGGGKGWRIRDWSGQGGRFISAEQQRETLGAAVGRCSSYRGGLGRQIRHGIQRNGAPFSEWDSGWARGWIADGDPVDRAETWAAAVEADPPDQVEANRLRAGCK